MRPDNNEQSTLSGAQYWLRILRRAAADFGHDRISLIASGVAFRATLALFPALTVLVWLASQFIGPDQIDQALRAVSATLPDSTRQIVSLAVGDQKTSGPGGGGSALATIGAILSLLFALWSANSGVKALFVALNTIFDRTEQRSFLRLLLITLAFTIGTLTFVLLAIILVVVGPSLLSLTGTLVDWLTAWRYLRWPLMFVASAFGLSILYAYAPNREHPRYSPLTTGVLVTALALSGAAAAFSWSVDHVARLSVTYGSLSTLIAFMIWLWLSSILVLAGAELDAAIEREKATQEGEGEPSGNQAGPEENPK